MASLKSLNCSTLREYGLSYEIDANPDVIVVAFLVSAWCALLVVLLVFSFSDAFPSDKKNDLDSDIIRCIRKLAKYITQPLERFKRQIPCEVIQKMILTLSDQQLITGTSIFIAAYANMSKISQYHFKIAYYLGAASFLTHQSTVMMIRDLLRNHPLMRAWRMLWVFAVFAFVFSANLIVYNSSFYEGSGAPVKCAVPLDNREFVNDILTVTSIFWAWGLVAVVRDLCPELRGFLSNLLDPSLPRLQKIFNLLSGRDLYLWAVERTSATQPGSASYYVLWLLEKVLFVPFLFCFCWTEILSSSVIDLYRVTTSLVALTFGIWSLKSGSFLSSDAMKIEEDNRWGFGQIISMLLLALPLFQALELLYDGQCMSTDNQGQAREKYTESVEPPAEFAAHPHHKPSPVPSGGASDDINAVRRTRALSTAQSDPGALPFDSSCLRHADTEMGRSSADSQPLQSSSSPYPDGIVKAQNATLEKRLYHARGFRIWMRVCVLALVIATCFICTGLFTFQIVI
ncbi:hypothetical protein BDW68DRAFT_192924 [Aspergillus falconensis]